MPYIDEALRARLAELIEEVETSTFRETKWARRGYNERDVDDFLDYLIDVMLGLLGMEHDAEPIPPPPEADAADAVVPQAEQFAQPGGAEPPQVEGMGTAGSEVVSPTHEAFAVAPAPEQGPAAPGLYVHEAAVAGGGIVEPARPAGETAPAQQETQLWAPEHEAGGEHVRLLAPEEVEAVAAESGGAREATLPHADAAAGAVESSGAGPASEFDADTEPGIAAAAATPAGEPAESWGTGGEVQEAIVEHEPVAEEEEEPVGEGESIAAESPVERPDVPHAEPPAPEAPPAPSERAAHGVPPPPPWVGGRDRPAR